MEFYHGYGPYPMPIEATENDMADIKNSFVQAALNAETAGFDGIEIHGANGYLLDQFLSNHTNTRSDRYGGSLENRVRLLTEVIHEIKQNVSPEFIAGIRISQGKVNDYHHKWSGMDEAENIFKHLKTAGVDYIHVTEYDASAPAFIPTESQIPSLAQIAKKTSGLPILANGSIDSLDKVNDALNKQKSDFVAIGKAALANHDFPNLIMLDKDLKKFEAENILRPFADIKDFELS